MMTVFVAILIPRILGHMCNITKGVENNIQLSSTKQLLFMYEDPTIQGKLQQF